MRTRIPAATAAAILVASSAAVFAQAQPDQAMIYLARGIHDRVITMDTHVYISAARFTENCNYTMRLTTQVNLPKMKEGGLDAPFLIVYTGQGALTPEGFDSAYKQAVEKFDAVHRLTKEIAPNEIELALTPADVVRINKAGKKVAIIGVENGYPIGTDLERVKEFYERGGRYMSLAHNGNSQLADSNSTEAANGGIHGGLSPLGKQVIAEMNKWGHDGGHLPPVQAGEHAGDRALEGAGHCLTFGGACAGQSLAQHGRRAVAGAQEKRRRDADGGVCDVREGG